MNGYMCGAGFKNYLVVGQFSMSRLASRRPAPSVTFPLVDRTICTTLSKKHRKGATLNGVSARVWVSRGQSFFFEMLL